jgi:hypothetical protein
MELIGNFHRLKWSVMVCYLRALYFDIANFFSTCFMRKMSFHKRKL